MFFVSFKTGTFYFYTIQFNLILKYIFSFPFLFFLLPEPNAVRQLDWNKNVNTPILPTVLSDYRVNTDLQMCWRI